MASPELAWAIAKIAADRAAAGVVAERYDVMAARASLPALDLPLPGGLRESETGAPGVPCTWAFAATAQVQGTPGAPVSLSRNPPGNGRSRAGNDARAAITS